MFPLPNCGGRYRNQVLPGQLYIVLLTSQSPRQGYLGPRVLGLRLCPKAGSVAIKAQWSRFVQSASPDQLNTDYIAATAGSCSYLVGYLPLLYYTKDMKPSLLKALGNVFRLRNNSRLLFSGPSLFGRVSVRQVGDRVELRTGKKHLQSASSLNNEITGSVWDYYLTAPAFLPEGLRVNTVCLLGLGVGTTAKLYNKVFSPRRIVGVEIDPVIIELGRKYFSLNDENLEIVCADAGEFIATTGEKFDLIIVDTFEQDCFSSDLDRVDFYSACRNHLNPGGVLVVNRATTKKQKEANLRFREDFVKIFPKVFTLTVHWNTFYFGLTEPLGQERVLSNLKKLGEAKNLPFLQKLNSNSLQVIS